MGGGHGLGGGAGLGGKSAGAVVGGIIGESMAGPQASGEIFFNDGGELAGEVVGEGPLVLVGRAGVGEGCLAFPGGDLPERVAGVAVFGDGGSAGEFGGEGGEVSNTEKFLKSFEGAWLQKFSPVLVRTKIEIFM